MEHHNENNELEAIRQGDESVFDTVFRRYYEPLCHYAAKFCDGDLDEAEDIVQQCFVKLWEKHAALDITWSIKSYLYKAVHNACLNRIRHQQTKNRYQQFNAGQLENNHSFQDESSAELRARLQEAMDNLPPQCRNIFELSRFEELKYREIAELLNISIKTVETQMGKALRVLRLQLADYLVTFLGLCFTMLQF
ncbi:MAG: RNA polymerase sigma-70 factor [Bacteroidota bacterium]